MLQQLWQRPITARHDVTQITDMSTAITNQGSLVIVFSSGTQSDPCISSVATRSRLLLQTSQ